MGRRKRYTVEEKVKILREVLEDGKSISQEAEQYGLHRFSCIYESILCSNHVSPKFLK